MIKSMTGYGAAEAVGCGKRLSVEMRSVNHRYSDINVKTPRNYGYLEETIKKTLTSYISRGKVDVYVNIESIEGIDAEVTLNTALARSYYNALHGMAEELGIKDKISIEHLTRFSDIFNVVKREDDSDEIARLVAEVTKNAAESFTEMRLREGEKLYDDLMGGLAAVEQLVELVEQRSPGIVEDYRNRLRDKIEELLNGLTVDEGRLLTEVAVFSDKVNTNEETVRLKSHISQMRELLLQKEPIGKKLDFLVQEMNREANTIGSKCNDIEVSGTVINIKAEIEKLREQIQNIE